MKPLEPSLSIKKIPALQRAYWSRPKTFSAKGDAGVDVVFTSVGRALTQWEKLEQRLANLFLCVCSVPNHSANPVRRAYGSVENSTLRRAAILSAAEVHFGDAWKDPLVEKSFNALIEAVSFASKRRDDIAHGIVQHFVMHEDEKTTDYGAFLFPPYYNSGRTSPYLVGEGLPPDFLWSDYRFTSNDINELEKKFGELKSTAREYVRLCAKRDGKIPFVEAITGKYSP